MWWKEYWIGNRALWEKVSEVYTHCFWIPNLLISTVYVLNNLYSICMNYVFYVLLTHCSRVWGIRLRWLRDSGVFVLLISAWGSGGGMLWKLVMAWDKVISYGCLGADMCEICIKSTWYRHNSIFSGYHALVLQIEIYEGNSVLKSNTEHTEPAFWTKTCLSLVLQHLYKLNFI